MLLALFAACAPDAEAWYARVGALELGAAALDFPETPLRETATLPLTLLNPGEAGLDIAVSTDAPFDAERAAIALGPGDEAVLGVRFRPTAHGTATGTLTLTIAGDFVSVPLTGPTAPDADGDGEDAQAAGGADCDDDTADVHPGAPDTCYDGLDADCAGDDDHDCDHDGAPATLDCDDADPAVSPLADADPTDGVDDDCDGLVDEDALSTGDVYLAELHADGPAWVEVCNAADRALALDGLTFASTTATATLSGTLPLASCAAFCAWSISGCATTADIALDPAADTLVLAAGGLVLDAVRLDGWDTPVSSTWSLDVGHGAADNNVAGAWCLTDGSPGEPNEACAQGR